MNLTRKNFLIGSMATAALGARQMFAATPGSVTGTPRLKVGVVSDTHLDCNTRWWFHSALKWYRDQKIDALIIAGDMTNYGNFYELLYTEQIWNSVFPDSKGIDGRPVTKLFCTGNHCVWPLTDGHKKAYKTEEELKKNVCSLDPKGAWERAFHEEYNQVYMKTLEGFQFVGSHWFWDKKNDAREAWFAANAKKIDPTKPFFYFQHQHPKDTCYGPHAWGRDDGTSTRLLSQFPNAIAFSGHSHYVLTDERSVWQGAFTSIGTASLCYTGGIDWSNASNEAKAHEGRHGMLLSICDDFVRIERREFVWNTSLGDDWILPVGKGAAKPYEYAKRAETRVAPEFAKDAVAKVELVQRKPDKEGKVPPPNRLKISYTAAPMQKNSRAVAYAVEAFAAANTDGKPVKKWQVQATDVHLSPSKAGGECVCVVQLKDLPKNTAVRFTISPIDCFGKKGKPLTSPNFTTPA